MSPVAAFLRRVTHPGAVVGASSDSAKFGGRVMQFLQYARRLPDSAPLVIELLREFVGQIVSKGPSELAAYGRLAIAGVRQSEDAKEGIAAFKQKRKPRFRNF